MRVYGRDMISQTQVDTKGAGKDILSVLLRANEAEESKLKLRDRNLCLWKSLLKSMYAAQSASTPGCTRKLKTRRNYDYVSYYKRVKAN